MLVTAASGASLPEPPTCDAYCLADSLTCQRHPTSSKSPWTTSHRLRASRATPELRTHCRGIRNTFDASRCNRISSHPTWHGHDTQAWRAAPTRGPGATTTRRSASAAPQVRYLAVATGPRQHRPDPTPRRDRQRRPRRRSRCHLRPRREPFRSPQRHDAAQENRA